MKASAPMLILIVAGALAGCREPAPAEHLRVADADIARGRDLVQRLGCGVCHVVPRVPGASGIVGPSLQQFGARAMIAGTLPNRPGTLAQFLRDAPSLVPTTAMPDFPLDERDARDVAAFLYSLR